MTYTEFTTRYPEFSTIDIDTIGAVLGEATREASVDVYGTRLDDAVGALAAHKLWISPAGSSLRGESDQTNTSDYYMAYQQIRRQMAPKFVVL